MLAGTKDGTLVFPNRDGAIYRAFSADFGNVMRRVVEREQKAGRSFRRWRIHDLRHGFAVRWLKNGGTIYRLSKHLGHTSIMTTEIYLAYLTAEEQEMALGRGQKTAQTTARKRKTAPQRVEIAT